MTEYAGRAVKIYKGASSPPDLIEGLREKGINASGEVIDVTTDDDDGYTRRLSVFGSKQLTISLGGLPISDALKDAWFGGNIVDTYTIVWPNGSTLVGQFIQANFVETDNHNDVAGITTELQSTGEWDYTPATP